MNFQGVKLRLERAECKCVPSLCRIDKCIVKFISRDRADLNIVMALLKPLTYLRYHIRSYYKNSNNEYRPMLLYIKDEFCKSYTNRTAISPVSILLKIVGKYINFNMPCPWPPGTYFIKDFNFNIKDIPSFIPEGRHMLNFTVYFQPDVLLINFKVYFQVTNHGILDLRVGWVSWDWRIRNRLVRFGDWLVLRIVTPF